MQRIAAPVLGGASLLVVGVLAVLLPLPEDKAPQPAAVPAETTETR